MAGYGTFVSSLKKLDKMEKTEGAGGAAGGSAFSEEIWRCNIFCVSYFGLG